MGPQFKTIHHKLVASGIELDLSWKFLEGTIMIWNFDDMVGTWRAPTQHDDLDEWYIAVCDDGSFSVNESGGAEYQNHGRKTFPTLALAKEWCEKMEAEYEPPEEDDDDEGDAEGNEYRNCNPALTDHERNK